MTFIRKIKRGDRIYLAEVKNYRQGAQVKQKIVRYLGLDPECAKDDLKFKISSLAVSDVKVYGPVIVLENIARELGFYDILGNIAAPILALVFGHCLNYRSVRDAQSWYEKTDLSAITGITQITIDQMHKGIEELSNYDSDLIQKSIFENMNKILGEDSSGIIYDVTNTHLSGKHSALASKGKDKEGVRGRKLIQIGLGVTREFGIPVFHHARPGNIHDIKMFYEAITQFKMMNKKPGLMVYDRGLTSKNCVALLKKTGWHLLAGLPMHKGIRSVISKMDFSNFNSFRNLLSVGGREFYAQSIPHILGGVSGKLIVLNNNLKEQKVTSERRLSIMAARDDFLEDIATIPEELKVYFNKKNHVNWHAIERAEKYDGLSFIFTDAKIATSDAVKLYFAKDLIERCFKLEKSVANLRPIRFWLDKKTKSHLLICHMALALLTTCRVRLEKKGLKIGLESVFSKIDSIYKIYLQAKVESDRGRDVKFNSINTMSNEQKDLVSCLAPNCVV